MLQSVETPGKKNLIQILEKWTAIRSREWPSRLTPSSVQTRPTRACWTMRKCSEQRAERASSASRTTCCWCRRSCRSSWSPCRCRPSVCPRASLEKVAVVNDRKSRNQPETRLFDDLIPPHPLFSFFPSRLRGGVLGWLQQAGDSHHHRGRGGVPHHHRHADLPLHQRPSQRGIRHPMSWPVERSRLWIKNALLNCHASDNCVMLISLFFFPRSAL